MSWLSQLEHGQLTPGQFLAKAAGELRGAVGNTIVHEGAVYVETSADKYKAAIEAITNTYLMARLGSGAGDLAAKLADLAIDTLATAVETAAEAVDATATGQAASQSSASSSAA